MQMAPHSSAAAAARLADALPLVMQPHSPPLSSSHAPDRVGLPHSDPDISAGRSLIGDDRGE